MVLIDNPLHSFIPFASFLDSSPDSIDPEKDPKQFTPYYFPSIDDFSSPMGTIKRVWTVISLTALWAIELISKIMHCFKVTHKKQELIHPPLDTSIDGMEDLKNLKSLFLFPVDYENFRYKVLTYKNQFYNNYGLDAFAQIKQTDFLEDSTTKEEKELEASLAVYDAIVKLYLDRFFLRYPQLHKEKYLPSLQTIALSIAIKISWDESIDNISFQRFIDPYMGGKQHGKMEAAFLNALEWDTSTRELNEEFN